ncbi:MAG: DsbA family protein [Pseudomonadota bacterium]|nr:DsbA family protein [Pseudomonadota bacterium]
MKLRYALALAVAVGFAPAARADSFSPQQKQDLGPLIRDYLVTHPEVLREAIDALDKRDKQAAEDARQKAVANSKGTIYQSKFQADLGNPKGGATLVEFFDYNCHFCKGALPDIAKLMQQDPDLHVVLKDFPVLGPGSVEAARVASAVRNQLPGERFWDFHNKLLGMHGPVGKKEALGVAKEMGLDMARLEQDMASKEVDAGLKEVMGVADNLQINGTPTFVVGDAVVVGAVGYDELKSKIDAVHKCGKATC